MDEVLKLFFRTIMSKNNEIAEVKTLGDLCRVSYRKELVEMFGAINDDRDAWSTEEVLELANEAYQEVLAS